MRRQPKNHALPNKIKQAMQHDIITECTHTEMNKIVELVKKLYINGRIHP